MKVAHFAPFAPNRCGLYEAARDFARADVLRDHEVVFVDTGAVRADGHREPAVVDGLDPRGGWLLRTSPWAAALDADLWVCHDGVSDSITARCQAPIVWVVHGRPLACFRPEQEGSPGRGFSIVPELASWPRVKAIVTMWAEFVPAWGMVAAGKLRCTGFPPLDGARYPARGEVYQIAPDKRGTHNLLICDSWRPDVDVYEVAVAAYEAARQRPGIKVHFWAVEENKQGPWQHVWAALDRIGALGEVHPREARIDRVYRAMDALVTPHVIGVRTVLEALNCGLQVVAGAGSQYTGYQANPHDAIGFASEIVRCLDESSTYPSHVFPPRSLADFGQAVESIYAEALDLEEVACSAS